MKKSFLLAVALLLVGAGCTGGVTTNTTTNANTETNNDDGANLEVNANIEVNTETNTNEQEDDDNDEDSHKVSFTVEGSSFSFSPSTIRVNEGDTVTIIFTNMDGTHDFVLEAFNVRTPQMNGGQSASVTFVADKTGNFEYYCSVGVHRSLGMKGTLIVE